MPSYDHPGVVHPRLGRLHAPDPRDADYPMKYALDTTTAPTDLDGSKSWWGYRYHLDQGNSPECVAFSAFHLLVDSPVARTLWGTVGGDASTLSVAALDGSSLALTPRGLYDRCQRVDEFPDTPPAGGTSVRAAQKVLQGMRLTASYWWAASIEDLVRAVLHAGPVHIGIAFYESMFDPVGDAAMISPAGNVVGGHAMKVDGVHAVSKYGGATVDLDETVFRIKNSWGAGWGRNGWCHMTARDMERLVIGEDGEGAIPAEIPV